jgi:replicative DNA helicase
LNAHDPNLRREVPANIEAEQALLGAILVNNAAYDRVASFLEPQHFNEKLHRKIYEVAGELIRMGRGVTPITIKSFLPENEKIGTDLTVAQYLVKLAAESVTIINARDYGLAVHEMWIRREAILAAEDVASIAYDLPPDHDVLAELAPMEEKLAALRAERVRTDGRKSAGQAYLEEMQAAYKRGEVRGVPIALPEIGEVISEPCFEAGNLYGLLSSSGEGKTSLTLQLISHALRAGHPVQFLSYDQSRVQCVRQMVAQEHGIEARRQRNPKLLSEREWETCVDFANWLDAQPFEVVKCTDHGAAQLVGFARTFLKRHGNGKVPFIVVDHIGSVKPDDRRADEGTKAKDINKVFKAGAETTDGAWLILNQRNSYGMRRDNPRPISADLFGGDPAKQAYDAILYLYRQEKFKAEREAVAASDADWKKIHKVFGSEVAGVAEIGAVKVRFGSPNIRKLVRFEDRFTRYVSEQRSDQAELIEGGW